jgi:hypothetical protein
MKKKKQSLVWIFFHFCIKFLGLKKRISKIIPIVFGHHSEKIRKIKNKEEEFSVIFFGSFL